MLLPILLLIHSAGATHRFTNRIVGGQKALIQQFPYQLALELEGFPFCGGSILTTNKALTAAHCTQNLQPHQLKVRAGSSFRGEGGQLIAVKSIHDHPLYSNCTQNNDVSVLTLATHLVFGATIAPIRLEPARRCFMTRRTGIVTGWGLLSPHGQVAHHLQAVAIYEVGNEECEFLFRPTGKIITRQMSCFGYPGGGKDACQGDSGSPLVSNGIQIGIVSWGVGCADLRYPGVFARISELRDHIDLYAYGYYTKY